MGDPELPKRTRLGPPGVDTDAFRPRPPEEAAAELAALTSRLEGAAAAGWGGEPGAAEALRALDPGAPLSLTASRQAQAYVRDRTELAINQFPVVTEADLPRLFADFHRPSLR